MGQNNQWLKPVLAQGVAMLLLLRLKNSPTEDVIQPTLEAWYRVITYKKREYPELPPPPPKSVEEMALEKAQAESNLQRLKAILRGKR